MFSAVKLSAAEALRVNISIANIITVAAGRSLLNIFFIKSLTSFFFAYKKQIYTIIIS